MGSVEGVGCLYARGVTAGGRGGSVGGEGSRGVYRQGGVGRAFCPCWETRAARTLIRLWCASEE